MRANTMTVPKLKEKFLKNWEELGGIEGQIPELATGGGMQSLLITSAASGDGRTTTAMALGYALAKSRPVLLVDAHVDNPALSAAHGTLHDPGLAEVLLDGLPLRNAVQPTGLDNLYLLPAGSSAADRADSMFRGAGFAGLPSELEEDWGQVIYDAPPYLTSPYPSLMARHLSGAVLVLSSGRTRWRVAQVVRERLERAEGKLVAAVLNRRRYYIPGFIYRSL